MYSNKGKTTSSTIWRVKKWRVESYKGKVMLKIAIFNSPLLIFSSKVGKLPTFMVKVGKRELLTLPFSSMLFTAEKRELFNSPLLTLTIKVDNLPTLTTNCRL